MQDDQPAEKADKPSDDKHTDTTWQFHDDVTGDTAANSSVSTPISKIKPVQWTASEFIAHHKDSSWYMMLGVVTVVVAAGTFLLTKDKISTGMVVFVGAIFGFLASRQPRELPYGVDSKGINIGQKFFPYSSFRSFAVVQEGGIDSIWLMPLKRFMPIMSIYFEPSDAEAITGVISQFLPLENHQLDPVDKLMHRIRF